jgi:molybdate transport system substrate-binding protein
LSVINLYCAGAAQAVASEIAAQLEAQTGHRVQATYGAVGAMKAHVVGGKPADVIVLSGALIDELVASGHVVAGSRVDLGRVGTGVAVRAGTPLPDVSSAAALKSSLLAAARIVCPDPATATAGKVVVGVLERLGIHEQVKARLQFFPNGYAAMADLAATKDAGQMGITQVTEILPNKGVTLVGPLPGDLQTMTTYSVGLAAGAQEPALARDFIGRLTGPAAQSLLAAAGYQTGG